ncbi:serine/threonine-protein phosphatase [Streptomyces sp. NA04227]|uniref:PP2C family protein-serine/threonine phosphatase n=1 Tax=Streptomyces sp. NA04227 TaxID=2742136 RepID=UPI001590E19F|nr:PP2C family protein-serine/threonine phosphatase [Streptomyces sp. NA04227]QKW10990.1 serine/threonine-protein phosphatase [Streptomyces sp. NA04227]
MSQLFVRALPVLLIVLGTVYDALTPPVYSALPMFSAAPLIAAPLYSRRGTLAISALACAAVLALRNYQEHFSNIEGRTEVVTVVTVSVLSLLVNRAVQRGGAQLASAREIAEAAQRAVLPEPPERLDGLQIAVRYEAAQEGAFIGGDLYAVQDTPYGVRMIVGDVRGKGMGAVATVAVLIGTFREAAEQEVTLEAVARRLEHALAREAALRSGIDGFEDFTTAVLAEIVHEGRVVRLLNRGHPGPLLLDGDGGLRVLTADRAALPIGLAELGGAGADRVQEIDFPLGATLLFHTDGLLEARNADGVFYDPVSRLEGRVFPAPGVLLATLVKEVVRHTDGGATDDMALLAVRRPVTAPPDDTGADDSVAGTRSDFR